MERLICVLIGYVFGLFETGYFYGKLNGVDIRQKGSGNAGATNTLRTLGIKAGIVTLIGDAFKCVFAVLLVYVIYGKTYADIFPVLAMYAGMGAVLGHNYPFYLKFRGGKGIAATGGLILSTTNPYMVLICIIVFVGIVAATRYVSVGSLIVVIVYLVEVVVYGQMGGYGVEAPYLYEMYAIAALLVVSAFFKHRANIQRLLSGTENKISFGKK